MEEKELINQIKQLAEIRPESEWVALTKSQILGPAPRRFNFDFALNLDLKSFKLAYLTLPAGIALVLVGFFVLNQQTPSSALPSTENQLIATSLKAVENSLNQVSVDLEGVEEPEKVLKAREAFLATIEKSEKVVAVIKETAKEPQKDGEVLAALEGVEAALSGVKQNYREKEKELVENLLQDLGGRSLSPEQLDKLEAATEYYEQENYTKALEEILGMGF